MTWKRPPRIATWMLKHFGSGPNNDALLGDLAEQYQQRANALWYWRQAMKAIPISLFREIRGHKLIAARALLTGWGIWILCLLSIFPTLARFFFGVRSGFAFGVYVPFVLTPFSPRQLLGTGWSVLWAPVLGQATVPGPSEGQPATFSFLFGVVLPLIVWAICGWLVARRFRDQRTAMVLLFAGSNLLMALLLFGPFALIVEPRPTNPLIGIVANAAASVFGIMLGGGLFRDRSKIEGN